MLKKKSEHPEDLPVVRLVPTFPPPAFVLFFVQKKKNKIKKKFVDMVPVARTWTVPAFGNIDHLFFLKMSLSRGGGR